MHRRSIGLHMRSSAVAPCPCLRLDAAQSAGQLLVITVAPGMQAIRYPRHRLTLMSRPGVATRSRNGAPSAGATKV